MSVSFQPTASTFTSYTLPIGEPKADEAQSWGTRIRAFIFGGCCKDWERSVFMTMSIANTFFAALCVLYTSFLWGAFFLLQAAIYAIGVRVLRTFASWSKNLKTHHENNDYQATLLFKQKLQLVDLAKNNDLFRAENEDFRTQLGDHKDLVRQQNANQALQTTLTGKLATVAEQNQASLETLNRMMVGADASTRRVLTQCKEMLTLGAQVAQQQATVSATSERLELSSKEMLQRAANMQEFFETTGRQFTDLIPRLNAELEKLEKAIARGEGQVEALAGVTNLLQQEVLKNAKVTGENAREAAGILQQLAQVTSGGGRATGRVGGNVHGYTD